MLIPFVDDSCCLYYTIGPQPSRLNSIYYSVFSQAALPTLDVERLVYVHSIPNLQD